jgi:hypothetical protein
MFKQKENRHLLTLPGIILVKKNISEMLVQPNKESTRFRVMFITNNGHQFYSEVFNTKEDAEKYMKTKVFNF